MKRASVISLFVLSVAILLSIIASPHRAATTLTGLYAKPATTAQFDDPYSEFRNVSYSNAGLLSERDEIKLGTQLHREVTKKYNLTNVGLERIERIGQRC